MLGMMAEIPFNNLNQYQFMNMFIITINFNIYSYLCKCDICCVRTSYVCFHWFFSFPLFLRKTVSVYTLFWIVCAPECLSARGNKIKKPEFIFIAKLCWTFTVDQVNKKNLGYRNELSQPAPKLRRKKQTSVKSTGMQGTGDPSNSGDKMFLQDS